MRTFTRPNDVRLTSAHLKLKSVPADSILYQQQLLFHPDNSSSTIFYHYCLLISICSTSLIHFILPGIKEQLPTVSDAYLQLSIELN